MCSPQDSTSNKTTPQNESVAKGVKAWLRGRLSLKKWRRILSSLESSPNSQAQVEPPKPCPNICSPQKRRRRGKKYSRIGISHSKAQEILLPEVVTPDCSTSEDDDYNHDIKTSTPLQNKTSPQMENSTSQPNAYSSIVTNESYTMSPLYDHDNLSRISLVPRSPPPPEILYEGYTQDLDGR